MPADDGGPIESYTDLAARVVSVILRPDKAADVQGWVQLAEAEIFRDCDIKAGDMTFSGVLSAGAETLDLPNGCLNVKMMRVENGGKFNTLTAASLDRVIARRDADQSGVPSLFAQFAETLELAPVANGTGAQAYKLWYYGTPPPLGPDVQTNLLLALAPDAYLYGALMHGAIRLSNPERQALYEPKFRSAKESLGKAYWRSRLPGNLAMQADIDVNDSHTRY